MGYFKIEDGERAYVQFVTDIWEWVTVDMHNMVPSKPKPADFTGENWPEKVSPICRLTKMGDGMPMYDDCYVCANITDPRKQNKPWAKTARIWAIGVLREEVLGNGSPEQGGEAMMGKRVGFKDKKVEVAKIGPDGKPTSEKEMKPAVVLFTMGWKNFFSAIEGTAQVNDGTITNLNFAIIRSGKELDTTYQITNLGKTKRDFNDPKGAASLGIKVDPSKVDAEGHPYKEYPSEYDMLRIIADRSSAEFYNKFLVPGGASSGSSNGTAKPSNDVSTEKLDEMQRRIQGYESDEASAATSGAPAEDPASDESFEPAGASEGEEMGEFE
jgi:hypothetical protein